MGVIIRAIGTPARLLRAGATTSPDFVFSNIGRDTVLAPIFSKSGFIPVWSSLEGGLTMLLGKTGVSKKAKKNYGRLGKIWWYAINSYFFR